MKFSAFSGYIGAQALKEWTTLLFAWFWSVWGL